MTRQTIVVVAMASAALWNGVHAATGQDAPKPKTGIELVGRSAKEPALEYWYVDHAKTKKRVATVYNQWGFTAVPPGEYVVVLKQTESEVPYATVEVAKDKVTRVEVKAGVEVRGRTDKEPAMNYWYVDDAKTKKRICAVYNRWGFTPVPPGEYVIVVRKEEEEIPYTTVQVAKDTVAKVELTTGIEVVGRSAKEPPLYYWHVDDSKTKKRIVSVHQRWGFTPLPPGDYTVAVHQTDHQVPYADVKVAKGNVARIEVKSGIELAGRSAKEPPLYYWHVDDAQTKKRIVSVHQHWGFTPVPPGEYTIVVHQSDHQVPYTTVRVTKDSVAKVAVKAGIDVAGRSDKEPPLYYWHVDDAKTKKRIVSAYQRWGFTPVPPGEYLLVVQQSDAQVPYTTVKVGNDEVARVAVKSGVEVLGRSPKEPPPQYWTVDDTNKNRLVSQYKRWGFTPLPPGEYVIGLTLDGYDRLDLPWSRVTVSEGKVHTLKVDSGIELVPRNDKDKPFEYWHVVDPARKSGEPKSLAQVHKRWGFLPLPPGEYGIAGDAANYPWARVTVRAGETTKLPFPQTSERLARVTGAGRKTEKERDPAGYKKLEEDVERAIRRAALWLKKQRTLDRTPADYDDSYLTIGFLALVHSGELERDPALADRCVDYLLRRPLAGTYANALTAMALADIDPFRYNARLFECAQWLVENQGWTKERQVWEYGRPATGIGQGNTDPKKPIVLAPPPEKGFEVIRRGLVKEPETGWDNSCSQFAVLGLHAAAHGGIRLPRESWERVARHFREVQCEDGGWSYGERASSGYGSMTCSGVASSLLARHHLGLAKAKQEPLALDESIVHGLEWLGGRFTLENNPPNSGYHYYYLYGLERVGVLAGTEFLGDHEWYPEGARYLLSKQNSDGSWKSKTGDGDYLDTCYAILFLRRATLPPAPPKPAFIAVTYTQPKLPPAIVPNIELVLDCSGSMDDKIKGNETRMVAARRAMDQLITDIPDNFNVGFRVFGHQGFWDWRTKKQAPDDHPGWYTDTELLVPIGPLGQGRAAMRKWINYMEPAGATPLVYALLQARKDFHDSMKGPKAVILISDGLENCKGKMEDVEKAYRGSGIDVVIHVVGFAISEKEHKVLELLAKWTKGNYYRADDAGQLAKALKDAMGSLQYVVQNEGGRVVAQGLLNGPGVALKAGTYLVTIQGIRETPLRVQLQSEERLRLTLDDAGRLRIAERK